MTATPWPSNPITLPSQSWKCSPIAPPGAMVVMPLLNCLAPVPGMTSGVVRLPPPRSATGCSAGRITAVRGRVGMDVRGTQDVSLRLVISLDQGRERRRRAADHFVAESGELLVHLGIGQRGIGRRVQSVDDLRRRSGGCEQGSPSGELEARQPRLGQRGDVRQRRQPGRVGGAEDDQPLVVQERQRGRERGEHGRLGASG